MSRDELLTAYRAAQSGEEALGVLEALEAEHPDDPDVLLAVGVAHREANRPARASELLARAIELILAGTLDANALEEAVSERLAALHQLDRPATRIDDHAEEALRRIDRQAQGTPIAVPWYPADEYALALERLPGFAREWDGHDHAAYCRVMDRRMRDVTGIHGHAPVIVPVQLDAYLAFADRAGLDPEWAETRARYADAHRDDAIAWPPGRNDPCWCGAGTKYKRHCGT